MGMFDSVMAKCPSCGGEVEFQSKAGRCNLDVYYTEDVPTEIAKDLSGQYENCRKCSFAVRLDIAPRSILTVKMKVS